MADHHTPVTITEEALRDAKAMWGNVTNVATFSIIGLIAVLALMALFLL